MYPASSIAVFIINWCVDHKYQITNLKLQKLLYFLQGQFAKKVNGARLISDDFFAWQLGPVIPSVYREYSVFSSSQIPKQNQTYMQIQAKHAQILDAILNDYAKLSTWTLVKKTHEEDPWKYTMEVLGNNAVIPFETISDYYCNKCEE